MNAEHVAIGVIVGFEGMWYPHDVRSHLISTPSLRNLAGALWQKVRACDPGTARQVITFITGVAAFLSATQYFAAKPSIRVEVQQVPPPMVNPGFVQEFYHEVGANVPRILLAHDTVAPLFDESLAKANAFVGDAQLGFSPLMELTAGPANQLIPELEALLKDSSWRKVLSGWSTRGGVSLEVITKQLPSLKMELTPREYRDFLAALLYGRVFENHIYVENDGDVDLCSVVVIIPSPLVRTSDSREDTILAVQCDDIHVCDVARQRNRAEVRTPILPRHHAMSFVVHTRESAIAGKEVVPSYDTGKPYSDLALVVVAVVLVTIAVHTCCKGKTRI